VALAVGPAAPAERLEHEVDDGRGDGNRAQPGDRGAAAALATGDREHPGHREPELRAVGCAREPREVAVELRRRGDGDHAVDREVKRLKLVAAIRRSRSAGATDGRCGGCDGVVRGRRLGTRHRRAMLPAEGRA
jgi:hypothetical protein